MRSRASVARSDEGLKSSQGLIYLGGAGGLIWKPKTLTPWLRKPKDAVPGTKMSFASLADPDDVPTGSFSGGAVDGPRRHPRLPRTTGDPKTAATREGDCDTYELVLGFPIRGIMV
jgi:hypothetical protein